MTKTIEAAFDELIRRQRLTPDQNDITTKRGVHVKLYLNSTFEMAEAPFLVGSYARQTLCASQRDIDIMAPFSVNAYWPRYKDDSRAFLYWVRNHLNDHYYSTKASSRQVAVTLDFTVITMDVVPCFRRKGGGYLMPSGNGDWVATNPPHHTSMIASSDIAKDGRLRPLIKLMKAWNISNEHLLSSFHVEMMVERMKRRFVVGPWASEASAVLATLPSWVRTSMDDPWTGGQRIDRYLTEENRERVLHMLDEDALSARAAEDWRRNGNIREAFDKWSSVFRGTFPAYG